MGAVIASEYVHTTGNAPKYWRAFLADSTFATHYGRYGSQGNITVHHYPGYPRVVPEDHFFRLAKQKERKGYVPSVALTGFVMPDEVVEAAASTNGTGHGGANKLLAWALIAFFHAANNTRDFGAPGTPVGDPMGEYVTSYEIAQKVALAGLAGHQPSPDIVNENIDELRVLASLTLGAPLPKFS